MTTGWSIVTAGLVVIPPIVTGRRGVSVSRFPRASTRGTTCRRGSHPGRRGREARDLHDHGPVDRDGGPGRHRADRRPPRGEHVEGLTPADVQGKLGTCMTTGRSIVTEALVVIVPIVGRRGVSVEAPAGIDQENHLPPRFSPGRRGREARDLHDHGPVDRDRGPRFARRRSAGRERKKVCRCPHLPREPSPNTSAERTRGRQDGRREEEEHLSASPRARKRHSARAPAGRPPGKGPESRGAGGVRVLSAGPAGR
jgi:hypothetical protein